MAARHAATQDEGLGWRVLACSCHLGGVEAAEGVCGLNHGPVTSNLRLRTEHIQLLRNGDTWNGCDIHQRDAGSRRLRDDTFAWLLQAPDPGDDHLSTHAVEVADGRLQAEENLGLLEDLRARCDDGARLRVGLVREARVDACAALDHRLIAVLGQLFCDCRDQADALITMAACLAVRHIALAENTQDRDCI